MRTVLTIGREPDNDFVINLPIVSGHHARLTWEGVPGRALLEDLGSSNGTAVGQVDRKIQRSPLVASDTAYFGNHAVPAVELMCWVDPSLAPTLVLKGVEMVIGRDPGCQKVVDRPTISGRHARLRRAGGRVLLEDLGSSNGTFVEGRRLEGPVEVKPGDLVMLGADTFRVAVESPAGATQRMPSMNPGIAPRPGPTIQVGAIGATEGQGATLHQVARVADGEGNFSARPSGGWVYPVTLSALLVQAPVLAFLIGLVSGGASGDSKGLTAALFALALAAVWFGLSTAAFGSLLDPARPLGAWGPDHTRFWVTRGLILGGLGVFECLLAQGIVTAMAALKLPTLSATALLVMASGIGLAAGGLIVLLSPRAAHAWGALGVVVVALALFGGGPWSLPRSAWVTRMASNAAPSRWAFEGLLVHESEARPAPGMAEAYFPAETDRMGPRADAMALASMLIGLLGLGLFVVSSSEPGRAAPSSP